MTDAPIPTPILQPRLRRLSPGPGGSGSILAHYEGERDVSAA